MQNALWKLVRFFFSFFPLFATQKSRCNVPFFCNFLLFFYFASSSAGYLLGQEKIHFIIRDLNYEPYKNQITASSFPHVEKRRWVCFEMKLYEHLMCATLNRVLWSSGPRTFCVCTYIKFSFITVPGVNKRRNLHVYHPKPPRDYSSLTFFVCVGGKFAEFLFSLELKASFNTLCTRQDNRFLIFISAKRFVMKSADFEIVGSAVLLTTYI